MSNQPTNSKSPFILVDGSSYLYRAFHALPPLTNAAGEPTGAMYGVINMLRRLLKDYSPEHVAVIFDAKGKTFRNDLYAEYKAHRPAMPEDLHAQIEPLHQIIRAMGFPILSIEGVEADDVIGTLAVQATALKMKTLISTGDKDMAQLVNDHITLINTMNNVLMDEKGVREKFGVPPNRIVDYLALVGDTSDNVPGVEKCGPKTAVKWIEQYGSLDNVMAHASEVTGKIGENLRKALDYLPLARQLVTIKTDVKLDVAPNVLRLQAADEATLLELYKRFEFKTWHNELLEREGSNTPPPVQVSSTYETILTEDAFNKWLDKLNSADLFAIDTETTSLNYMQAELVGMSFCVQSGEACYLPLAHNYLGAPKQLDRAWVLTRLKPLLEDTTPKKIGQHIKYDINVLKKYDIHLQGVAFDTMLESYCLNSVASRHDMDSLALKYLNKKTISFEEVAGKGAKQITFNLVELNAATQYAAEDADITLQLHQVLWAQLKEQPGPAKVFETLEMPLIDILSRMEYRGVYIDVEKLHTLSAEFAKRMKSLEDEVYRMAGMTFNLESPKQLQEVLFDHLKLPVIKKTPTGQPSTAEPILQELALNYPLPKVIMEYRTLSKLKSTYTDKLPLLIDPNTGRIHTSYHQAIASTGRLSSSDPNLQNIPVRAEEGRAIRSAFKSAPGYKIVSTDYSQVELRIMAHLSGDKGLLTAFEQGLDIHAATAAEVFGIALEAVTHDQRRKAKAINFGLIYGMSAFGLAKQLSVDRHDAQHYIDTYFARYPGVKKYMEDTRKKAHQQGYVETLMGRRLYLPMINSKNKNEQMAAERVAINAPMQGTAADIIKQAMINVQHWLDNTKVDAIMVMQVHDELVFEVKESSVDLLVSNLPKLMSSAANLKVPLLVSVGTGNNWDAAHG